MAAVVALIDDLKAAKAAGRKDADLLAARYLQRRSQFYLDFVEAENSTGFHAPQEAARILGESIDFARQGQIALRDPSFKPTVPVVNIPPPASGEALRVPGNPQEYGTRGRRGLLTRAGADCAVRVPAGRSWHSSPWASSSAPSRSLARR